MTVAELIREGYGNEEDFNCAEKILNGANKAYELNLSKETLKLAAGFGGGMGIDSTCGALTGSVMVLSHMFVKERGHEGPRIKELTQELFSTFEEKMGNIMCAPLKKDYRTEELGCKNVILAAAEVLDAIVERELKKDAEAAE